MNSKVLVVGPSWVGDMVMADSLFQHLQATGACVDVLAPGWSLPVLERMPSVNRGIELAVGHGELGLRKRRELGKALRGECYDQAIVLPRSLKSALVPYFAKIPVRTGFRGEMRFGFINDIRPFDKSVLNQTVKRFSALGLNKEQPLGTDLPNPVLRVAPASLQSARERLNLPVGSRQVALLPGAEYGPAKCWPLEYFRELSQSLLRQGAEVWVMGSAKTMQQGKLFVMRHAPETCVERRALLMPSTCCRPVTLWSVMIQVSCMLLPQSVRRSLGFMVQQRLISHRH